MSICKFNVRGVRINKMEIGGIITILGVINGKVIAIMDGGSKKDGKIIMVGDETTIMDGEAIHSSRILGNLDYRWLYLLTKICGETICQVSTGFFNSVSGRLLILLRLKIILHSISAI